MKETGWTKLRAGHYRKDFFPNPETHVWFEVWYDSDYKKWYCTRCGGPVFDCAKTMAEAKTFCVEPEDK